MQRRRIGDAGVNDAMDRQFRSRSGRVSVCVSVCSVRAGQGGRAGRAEQSVLLQCLGRMIDRSVCLGSGDSRTCTPYGARRRDETAGAVLRALPSPASRQSSKTAVPAGETGRSWSWSPRARSESVPSTRTRCALRIYHIPYISSGLLQFVRWRRVRAEILLPGALADGGGGLVHRCVCCSVLRCRSKLS